MACGRMDYYVLKPWRRADEFFHRTVTEFLHEWERASSDTPQEVALVCERALAALARAARPAGPQRRAPRRSRDRLAGGATAARRGRAARERRDPVVILLGGGVLVDPTNAELADAYGVSTDAGGALGLRRGHRRRRAGRTGRRRVRLLRGPRHAGGRARVDRRPGRRQLADPQLPRLRARDQRGGARPARLPAGLDLRRTLPPHARGHRAATRRRPPRAQPLRRQRGQRRRGGAGHRHLVPAPGNPGARGARSAPACSTARRCRRPAPTPARRCTWWAAATPPARPRCTCAATPAG